MSTLRIRNWDRWQTYRKGRGLPPWIKVHRQLLRDPNFVALTDAQRGQLLAMWIIAADRDGLLPNSPAMIRKLCYMDADPDLQVFVSHGFLEHGANAAPTRRQDGPPEVEAEAEAEADTETTAPASPTRSVENSGREDERPQEATPDGSVETIAERPTYTLAALAEAARVKLGLGIIPRADEETNKRLLRKWLYAGAGKRDPEDIMLAIVGAADMRDRDLVGWDSAKPGRTMTLKALEGAMTLDHTGDGAPRYLYDVARDHQRKREEADLTRTPPTTARVKGQPMKPLAALIPQQERAG